jgi:mRNA-degrading endonuclease RelE of RelBE toxin-antitoxin system
MAFRLEVSESALKDLKTLRAYDRKRIVEAIDEQLAHQPDVETRNRKCLPDVKPTFEHRPPLWELRVGVYRILYDVDGEAGVVSIRAVRQKLPDQTTENLVS